VLLRLIYDIVLLAINCLCVDKVEAQGTSVDQLYGDLGMPSFARVSQHADAPAAISLPAKRAAKPKQERPPVIALSLDIEDSVVFRHRWDQEITKECSSADAMDMKMTAEDRSMLGISVRNSDCELLCWAVGILC
jgi:hypothetical protein